MMVGVMIVSRRLQMMDLVGIVTESNCGVDYSYYCYYYRLLTIKRISLFFLDCYC